VVVAFMEKVNMWVWWSFGIFLFFNQFAGNFFVISCLFGGDNYWRSLGVIRRQDKRLRGT